MQIHAVQVQCETEICMSILCMFMVFVFVVLLSFIIGFCSFRFLLGSKVSLTTNERDLLSVVTPTYDNSTRTAHCIFDSDTILTTILIDWGTLNGWDHHDD